MKKRGKVFAGILLILSIFFIGESIKLKSENWAMSPGLFPLIISILIGLFSLALLFSEEDEEPLDLANLRKPGLVFLLSLIYLALFSRLGFLGASFIYLVGYLVFLGERDIRKVLSIGLLGPLCLYLIFSKLLGVVL